MGEIFAGKGRGSNDTILEREQSMSRHIHVMHKMGEFFAGKGLGSNDSILERYQSKESKSQHFHVVQKMGEIQKLGEIYKYLIQQSNHTKL